MRPVNTLEAAETLVPALVDIKKLEARIAELEAKLDAVKSLWPRGTAWEFERLADELGLSTDLITVPLTENQEVDVYEDPAVRSAHDWFARGRESAFGEIGNALGIKFQMGYDPFEEAL